MATFDAGHINNNGAFELTEKSALIKSFRDTYADITAGGAFTPTAAPAVLTDSSGGTPSSTLATIAAGAAYAQADLVAVKNAVASLNTQINALRTALRTSGILT